MKRLQPHFIRRWILCLALLFLPSTVVNAAFYYVNDSSTNGDVYTQATGNDEYIGNDPCCPKASIQSVLANYPVATGDVIYVDTGTYLLTNNITINPTNSGLEDALVEIHGSTNFAAGGSVLGRNSTGAGNYAIHMKNTAYILLTDLTITGGIAGIYLQTANNCILSNVAISGAGSYGIWLASANNNRIIHSRIYSNTLWGINCSGESNTIEQSVIAMNGSHQVQQGIGSLNMRNCIFAAGATNKACILWNDGTYAGDYNDFHATNGAVVGMIGASTYYRKLIDWQTSSGQDENSLAHNPLFANPAAGDFHLRSVTPAGTFISATRTWTNFAEHSPCIDTGDPTVPYGNESSPNGDRLNMGAYGDTDKASLSRTDTWVLAVSLNDGGTVRGTNVVLRWRTNLTNLTDTVKLEYAQSGTNGWIEIATNLPAVDHLCTWDSTPFHGSPFARWRIVVEADTNIWDATDGTFELRPFIFYVNDNSTNSDNYCTAIGSDSNHGASSNEPKATLDSVLSTYDMDYGDTVFVDVGRYTSSNVLAITAADGGSTNGYVYIRGTTNTVINRLGTSSTAYGLSLSSVRYIDLCDLTITGGYYGVYLNGASVCRLNRVNIRNPINAGVVFYGSSSNELGAISVLQGGAEGLKLTSSAFNRFTNCLFAHNAEDGVSIQVNALSNRLENCVITHNADDQIFMSGGSLELYNSIVTASGLDKIGVNRSNGGYIGDYNDFFTSSGALVGDYTEGCASLADWQQRTGQDSNSLNHDPLFANAASNDFHLKSVEGRQRPNGTWTNDAVHSPCIDLGDPSSSCTNETDPNGSRINLGAYGNTAAASHSRTDAWVLALSYNDGGTVRGAAKLRWAFGNAPGADVTVEYSADAGLTWSTLTTVPASQGSYEWDTTTVGSCPTSLWRVVLSSPAVTDVVDRVFVVNPVAYYVNDEYTTNDIYCTASGSTTNLGVTPDAPISSLQRLLSIHDIEPSNTIYIDSGYYLLTNNVEVDASDGGSSNAPVVICGSTNYAGGGTVLARSESGSGSYGIYLNEVLNVRVSDFICTGGYYGVYVKNSRLGTIRNIETLHANSAGIGLDGANQYRIEHCVSWSNQNGITITGTLKTNHIDHCTIAYNRGRQILLNSGSLGVSNSIMVASGSGYYCVYASGTAPEYRGDFNDLCAAGGAYIGYYSGNISSLSAWQTASTQDTNSLSHDPLFADPYAGDFHLQSMSGRYVRVTRSWVKDPQQSPCIDTGDPIVPINEPEPNGGVVNMGAYGNTWEASLSTNNWLLAVTYNDGGTARGIVDLHWDAVTNFAGTVQLEYSVDDGGTWLVIATNLPATNRVYTWDTTTYSGSPFTRWRVVSEANPNIRDMTDTHFELRPFILYVNDGNTVGDVYCNAVGSSLNTGASSNSPLDSLRTIFQLYDIEYGDRIFVDTGYYPLPQNVDIGSVDGGSSNDYVYIRGSSNGTVLGRTAQTLGASSLAFASADYFDVADLTITGGYYGVSLNNVSHSIFQNIRIYGTANQGIRISNGESNRLGQVRVGRSRGGGIYLSSASANIITNSTVWMNNGDGITIAGPTNVIRNCTIAYNTGDQLRVLSGEAIFSHCIAVASRLGTHCIGHDGGLYYGDYNDLYVTNGGFTAFSGNQLYARLIDWQAAPGSNDQNSIAHAPQFADTASGDFHLRSLTGRYINGAWTNDLVHSPCIDAGMIFGLLTNEPAPHGNRVNLGAYGDTAEASLSRTDAWVTAVSYNDGGTARRTVTLTWLAGGGVSGTADLYYSLDGGNTWSNLGSTLIENQNYSWNTSLLQDQPDVKWRIELAADPTVSDNSDNLFAVNPQRYFVNDSIQAGDLYCSQPGDDRNDGVSTNRPMSTFNTLLAVHKLEPPAILYIDTGEYLLTNDFEITAADAGTATSAVYVTIQGSTNGTVIERTARDIRATAIYLNQADRVSVKDLTITGGYYAVSFSGSSYCQLSNVVVHHSVWNGIHLDASDYNILQRVNVHHCKGAGIYADDSDYNQVCFSTIWTNGADGVFFNGNSNSLRHCVVAFNRDDQVVLGGGSLYSRYNIVCAEATNSYCLYRVDGSIFSDYNDIYPTNGASVGYYGGVRRYLVDWQANARQDTNSLAHDPLFVDTSSGDFHLRSLATAGTFITAIGSRTNFYEQSPCIDAGPFFGAVTNEPAPDGGHINLGAYGETDEASLSNTNDWLLAVSFNDGGTARGNVILRWLNGVADTNAVVEIDYSRDGGIWWQSLTNVPATNLYCVWTTTNYIGSPLAVWRLFWSSVTDTVDRVFNVRPFKLYVNDEDASGDVYCSAPGNPSFAGISANEPALEIQAVLKNYELDYGDSIYIDTGYYLLSSNILISSKHSGSSNGYVRLIGSTNTAAGGSRIDRNSVARNSRSLHVDGADYIQIYALSFTGGEYAVEIDSAEHNLLENVDIMGASKASLFVNSGESNTLRKTRICNGESNGVYALNSEGLRIYNSLIAFNQFAGLYIDNSEVLLQNCTIASNAGHQVRTGGISSDLQAKNTIFVVSDPYNYCIYSGSGTYRGNYNDFFTVNGGFVGFNENPLPALSDWQKVVAQDTNSLSHDPLFAGADDFHVMSVQGRYTPDGSWTNDSVHSPCIDAGEPGAASTYTNEPAPHGNRANVGAYGSMAEASMSNTNGWLTALTFNDGGLARSPLALRWIYGGGLSGTVTLEYSPDNGTNWLTIASGVPITANTYSWSTTNHSSSALWRISQGAVTDVVDQVFILNPDSFYVNDEFTDGDVFCTAPGTNSNRGVRPDAPAATVQDLLAFNDLEGGDTVYVDVGYYLLTNNIVIGSSDSGGGLSRYVRICGNMGTTNSTVFVRANASNPSSFGFYLNEADRVQLSDFILSNGYYGIYLNASAHCILSNIDVVGSTYGGIYVVAASNVIANSRVWDGAYNGIIVAGTPNTVINCVAVNNTHAQLAVEAGGVTLQNSILHAGHSNMYCIYRTSGSYAGDYNDLFTTNGGWSGYYSGHRLTLLDWQTATRSDSNSLSHDPLFVDMTNADFHLRSIQPSGTFVKASGTWTNFGEHSPCIDTAPPFTTVTNEPVPHGGRINIGAYGNTPEASLSITNEWVLALGLNNGDTIRTSCVFRWTSGNLWTGTPATVEFSRDYGVTWIVVETNVDVTVGFLPWDPTGVDGSPMSLWRVSASSATDTVDHAFLLRPFKLYANDADSTRDLFCTAVGTTTNLGVSSNGPVTSIKTLLDLYDLDYEDTVYIDTGIYATGTNLLIGSEDAGSTNGYVSFIGSTNGAILDRMSTAGDAYAVQISQASYVRLSDLILRNAFYGLYAEASDYMIVTNLAVSNCYSVGVHLFDVNHAVFDHFTVNRCAAGLYVNGQNNLFRHGVIHSNTQYGAYFRGIPSNTIDSCTFAYNGTIANPSNFQIRVEQGGWIRNCIMAAAGLGLYCYGNGMEEDYAGDYNNFFRTNGSMIAAGYTTLSNWQVRTGQEGHSLELDPLFVNPSIGDFHLRSTAPNGTYSIALGAWTSFATNSPCIDTGCIHSPNYSEPAPNGGIINIGAYGNTPEASLSVDTDGDGLSDTFEIYARARRWAQYSYIPFGTSITNVDTDGDASTDYEEFVSGTDPLNAIQCFQITNLYPVVSNSFLLSWYSAEDRLYSVESSTNLMSGFGVIVSNIPATPPINTYSVGLTNVPTYFRIVVSY